MCVYMHAHIIIEKDFENELNMLLDTEEHVDLRITKVLLTGAGGSGKTCTKHILYNKPSPAEYQSTDLIEPTEKTVRTRDLTLDKAFADSYHWSVVNSKDDVFSMVRATISSKDHRKKYTGRSRQSLSRSQIETGELPTGSHTEAAESSSVPSGGASESPPGSPSKAKEDLLRILNDPKRKSGKCVDEVHWIFLMDSGGQSQFHDILPAFLHGYSVILCVIKLSEPLDKQTFDDYFEKGKTLGKSKKSHYTVKQILKGIVQSVHCTIDCDKRNSHTTASTANIEDHHATGNDQDSSPTNDSTTNDKVKLLIIGTYKDKATVECMQQIGDELKTMFSDCETKINWVYYINESEEKKTYFPLNARDQDPDSKLVAEEIRKVITEFPSVTRPIPISWFLLEEDITEVSKQTDKHGIISKTDCEEIGKKLKLTSKSVEKALEYFHDLNIFFYFSNSEQLSHLVFTKPQVVVSIISAFVKIACGEATDSEHEKFKTTGQFSYSFIKSSVVAKQFFRSNKECKFNAGEVIELLTMTLVVAPIVDRYPIEYFMPCILPCSQSIDIERKLKRSNNRVAPIAIKLSGECIPRGFFCALVCNLLSKTWELCKSEKESTFKNFLQFNITDMPCSVALVDSFYFISVHIFGQCEKDTYQLILSDLKKSVIDVVEKHKYNKKLVMSYCDTLNFPCNCGEKPEHVVKLIERGGFTLKCQSTNSLQPITRKHAMWFNEKQFSKWQETRGITS